MTFDDEFTAAVRREAKKAQQKAVTEATSATWRKKQVLGHGNSFLRVVTRDGFRTYDMENEDPDKIFVTLRDPK
jgi:hypothetical protein